jgi:hypothetical protein
MYQNRQVVLFNTLPFFGAAWQRKYSRRYLVKLNRLVLAHQSSAMPACCCLSRTRISSLLRLPNEATTGLAVRLSRLDGITELKRAPDHRTELTVEFCAGDGPALKPRLTGSSISSGPGSDIVKSGMRDHRATLVQASDGRKGARLLRRSFGKRRFRRSDVVRKRERSESTITWN